MSDSSRAARIRRLSAALGMKKAAEELERARTVSLLAKAKAEAMAIDMTDPQATRTMGLFPELWLKHRSTLTATIAACETKAGLHAAEIIRAEKAKESFDTQLSALNNLSERKHAETSLQEFLLLKFNELLPARGKKSAVDDLDINLDR